MTMTKSIFLMSSLCLVSFANPSTANVVMEPTFSEKMAESELVIIGTVTAVDRGARGGRGSTATLAVSLTLKGKSPRTVIVKTYHPVAELNPRCCEPGATYLMFLRHAARDGQLASAWGSYGMVRIGGPLKQLQEIR
jgi:hypothetical protein